MVGMRAAEYCARFLRARGVRRVFGIPGGESVELIEALRRLDVAYVLAHHEAAAGFMAAATAQLSGVPGVCIVTRGPGAMNLYPGIATAHLDRRPVVAISGDHPPSPTPRDTHQRLPLVDLYTPITRWSGRLAADSLPETLPCSWDAALRGQPGPVYWSFPSAEAEREVPADAPAPDATFERTIGAPGRDLDVALARIAEARRPLVMAGIGVARAELAAPLLALVERLGCPAMVTSQVKGWIPEDHPLFAGTFGAYRDEPLHALMEEADLIVAVGLDGVDFYKRWRATTPVVSLAEGGADDPTFQPAVASDGDLLVQLRRTLEEARPSAWPADRAAAAREGIADVVRPKLATAPDGNGERMPPQVAVEELRRALPPDGILTVDVGSHKIVVVQQWRAPAPNTFICSNGLSPMGTGLPFAIGAQLERPDTPVACVLGDGGFLMYTGELETVARLNLPIVLVVTVDDALSSIKVKQVRKAYPSAGVEFSRPDYAQIARGFGLDHARVADRAACRAAIERALASRRATLVEALVDPEEYNTTQ